MNNPLPCKYCRAEAMVIPTALGWTVECSLYGGLHNVGPYKSRDKAVKTWNERQRRD